MPPPQTVAPRAPKPRSAYRKRRKSDSERAAERAESAAEAVAPGRTAYLDATALAARAAAAAAPAAARRNAPPLLVIDGYNFLHAHPPTAALLSAGRMHAARSLLHQLLKDHADESGLDVLVVYDATGMQALPRDAATGARGMMRTTPAPQPGVNSSGTAITTLTVSARVQAHFAAGREADTFIIDAVSAMHAAAAAAAAAAGGGRSAGPPRRPVRVYTNDRRIADACNAPALWLVGTPPSSSSGDGGGSAASEVFVHGCGELSRALTAAASRLSGYAGGATLLSEPAALAAAVDAAARDRRRRTAAATRSRPVSAGIQSRGFLDDMSLLSLGAPGGGATGGGAGRRRAVHSQQQQQEHEEDQQRHVPSMPELSDAELLQAAATAITEDPALVVVAPHTDAVAAAADSGPHTSSSGSSGSSSSARSSVSSVRSPSSGSPASAASATAALDQLLLADLDQLLPGV